MKNSIPGTELVYSLIKEDETVIYLHIIDPIDDQIHFKIELWWDGKLRINTPSISDGIIDIVNLDHWINILQFIRTYAMNTFGTD